MSNLLIGFTMIGAALILYLVPTWLAKGIDLLNNVKSPLAYIPFVNSIRAEISFFSHISYITISSIALLVTAGGAFATWFFMYGSTLSVVMRYVFFFALGFWYIARVITAHIILTELGMVTKGAALAMSIVYPFGFYSVYTCCKMFSDNNAAQK